MGSSFFQNRDCEYFPCHETSDPQGFNCLFCFCPLYPQGEACDGDYVYQNGIKDCSGCQYPHDPASYAEIVDKLRPTK